MELEFKPNMGKTDYKTKNTVNSNLKQSKKHGVLVKTGVLTS